MFRDRDGETLVKKPGDINGIDFMIKDLKNCTVFLLDHTAQIQVDRAENCTFYIGPIKASIFVRNSKNCKFTIACSQFRCRDLYSSELFLYTPNDPIIESSSGLAFAPYNFKYGLLHAHTLKADLLGDFVDDDGVTQKKINKWAQIFDFTAADNNFSLVDAANWKMLKFEEVAQGLGLEPLAVTGEEDDFLFELPVEFGGTISQEMLAAQAS